MNISELICYVLDYLDVNLHRNVSNDELSDYFGYDKTYLIKKFKNETDFTVRSYVNIRKVFNSLGMLASDERLLKVALESGYNSLEYYSEMFTKILKTNPSTFKKLLIKLETMEEYMESQDVNDEMKDLYLRNILSDEELEAYYVFRSLSLKLEDLDSKRESKSNSKILRLEIPQKEKMVA